MRQVLFTIPVLGGVKIFGYGLMLFLAFLGSMNLAAWRAPREKLDPEVIYDLALWVFLGGLVGARLFYVDPVLGRAGPQRLRTSSRSGRAGSSSTAASSAGRSRSSSTGCSARSRSGRFLDVVAPSLALGIALGRLGCFLNGCCYGDLCPNLPWACGSRPLTPLAAQLSAPDRKADALVAPRPPDPALLGDRRLHPADCSRPTSRSADGTAR